MSYVTEFVKRNKDSAQIKRSVLPKRCDECKKYIPPRQSYKDIDVKMGWDCHIRMIICNNCTMEELL